jgi:class 3 adenylate cyclase
MQKPQSRDDAAIAIGNIAIRSRPANRGAEFEQALATILFVDIVGSTEKAARLGDSRWTQVMNHYYAAVRRELKTLRGKEVVTTGDGQGTRQVEARERRPEGRGRYRPTRAANAGTADRGKLRR